MSFIFTGNGVLTNESKRNHFDTVSDVTEVVHVGRVHMIQDSIL